MVVLSYDAAKLKRMKADDEKLTMATLRKTIITTTQDRQQPSDMIDEDHSNNMATKNTNWVCETPIGRTSTMPAANCFTSCQLAAPRLPDESRMNTRSRGTDREQSVVAGAPVVGAGVVGAAVVGAGVVGAGVVGAGVVGAAVVGAGVVGAGVVGAGVVDGFLELFSVVLLV